MARIADIDRRLQNWARWRIGGQRGGLGYASVNLIEAGGGRDGYVEAVVPTIDAEASETDMAVMALASELRRTVEVVYILNRGMREKCRLLAVAEATVHSRVDRAHQIISGWLADRAQRARDERGRVEQLQRV